MMTTFSYSLSAYDVFQKHSLLDEMRANYSHRCKLGMTRLKAVYMRLYQELSQYTKTGHADYLQVVWKRKIFDLCEILLIDNPSWLALSAYARLPDFKFIFSDAVSIIPVLERPDRAFLTDLVGFLLQNWESYIEQEVPQSDDEVLLCLAFEQTSMKEFYRNELHRLGMTSFSRAVDCPFQITGQVSPEAFQRGFAHMLVRHTGYQASKLPRIVSYRVGSQSSLGSFE